MPPLTTSTPTSLSSSSTPVRRVCPRCGRTFDGGETFCPDDGARLVDDVDDERFEQSPSAPCSTVIAGRYELGPVIGQGSMARVYKAVDQQTGKEVAVKILGRRWAEKASERSRFFRGARAALRIDHPNVVKVLDVGRREDGRPFIVIEYLEGETLGDLVRREKRLTLERALPIFQGAAEGLVAVHKAGIVHRDVKPDNIFLVHAEEDTPDVRIVDFGLAKLHAHGGVSNQGGIALGTAAYMAPEQVLSEEVDARSDVYSLGVVMFRALTGHFPFEGENDLDMLAHQVLLPAPPPSWFFEDLAEGVDRVVMRAMRKCPRNRYPDMEKMLEDIVALRRGRKVWDAPGWQETDYYRPKTALGRRATRYFCDQLGVEYPEWLKG